MTVAAQRPSDKEQDILVILVGLGAVATTLVAGTSVYRKRGTLPDTVWALSGSVSDRDGAAVPVRDLLQIPPLSAIRFAAFDIREDTALDIAQRAGVLSQTEIDLAADDLAAVRAMRGVTDDLLAREGNSGAVDYIRARIRDAKAAAGTDRAVMLLALSTESADVTACHAALDSVASLDAAMASDTPRFSASIVYTVAALLEDVPLGNLTPNCSVELPAIQALARQRGLPVAGGDLKTGQTFLKTVLAPALLERGLRIIGWFGANILGNGDGLSLTNKSALAAKLRSKSDPLRNMLKERDLDSAPEVVCIDYYPPRGDNKESWDCIDFRGWLDYPMAARLNVQCRDSILAAPLALDVALLLDASKRAQRSGPQDWLACFFKAPVATAERILPAGFEAQVQLLKQVVPELKASRGTARSRNDVQGLFQEIFDEASRMVRARTRRTPDDDRELESWIADRIARALPNARILGEERTRREPAGDPAFTVLIDPIDGSSNYYRGLPDVGLALALVTGTELRLDRVDVSLVGHLLNGWSASAVRGQGLQAPSLDVPLPAGRSMAFDFDGPFSLETFGALLQTYGSVRRLGSTTLELALVATGALNAFVDVRGTLTPENFLAPSLLISEAGGALTVEGAEAGTEFALTDGFRVFATHAAVDLPQLVALARPAAVQAL